MEIYKHFFHLFNESFLVAIKTPQGRKTLNGREYKVFSGEALLSVEENISDKRLMDIVANEFFIKRADVSIINVGLSNK